MELPAQLAVAKTVAHATRAVQTVMDAGGKVVRLKWPILRNRIRRLALAIPAWIKADGDEMKAWSIRLIEEKTYLLDLIRSIETEFLDTGRGLSQLTVQLQRIQRLCAPLTDQNLGCEQNAAVQFAFQLLKKAEDLVVASYDQYDHVFANFAELKERLARLGVQHVQLMRILFPLNLITVAIRIEASRHPSEVQDSFLTLASNVKRAVDEVRRTMDRQFDELAGSERTAQDLMDQVADSIAEHREKVTAVLATSRQLLQTLHEALLASAEGASALASLGVRVTSHVGTIVGAQQCQDITRQMIEHVGEAMEEMRSHLDDAGARSGSTEEAHHFIAQAAMIQWKQTRNVFSELDRAAGQLRGGIQGLREEGHAAALAASKVGGSLVVSKVTQDCQNGIGEILTIICQSVRKIGEILSAFEPLRKNFVDCSKNATDLAIEVRLAALNAQVFAIQAPDGAALEVLSGRVREVSDEAIQHVAVMSTELHETIDLVNQMRRRLEDFQELGALEQQTLTAEFSVSRSKLADVGGAIPSSIRGITDAQAIFAQAVEDVLETIRFPDMVGAASERSLSFFEELAVWGEDRRTLEHSAGAHAKIAQLRARYTMDAEREAHEQIATSPSIASEATTPPPCAEVPAEVSSSGSDFGDNVELF